MEQLPGLALEHLCPDVHFETWTFNEDISVRAFGPNRALDEEPARNRQWQNAQVQQVEQACPDSDSDADGALSQLWPDTESETELDTPVSWNWQGASAMTELDPSLSWTADSRQYDDLEETSASNEPRAQDQAQAALNVCMELEEMARAIQPLSTQHPVTQTPARPFNTEQPLLEPLPSCSDNAWEPCISSSSAEQSWVQTSEQENVIGIQHGLGQRQTLSLEAALPSARLQSQMTSSAAQIQPSTLPSLPASLAWQRQTTQSQASLSCGQVLSSTPDAWPPPLPKEAFAHCPQTPTTCSAAASTRADLTMTSSQAFTPQSLSESPLATPVGTRCDRFTENYTFMSDDGGSIKKVPSAACKSDVSKTTVMIRRLPKTVNQRQLLQELNVSGFCGLYDFCYLPCNFASSENNGYAFVNFLNPEAANRFRSSWHGTPRAAFTKPNMPAQDLSILPAEVQGLEANLKKWSTRIARIRNPDLKPYILSNALELASPRAQQGLEDPKPKLAHKYHSDPGHHGGRASKDQPRIKPEDLPFWANSMTPLSSFVKESQAIRLAASTVAPKQALSTSGSSEANASVDGKSVRSNQVATKLKATGTLAVQKARALLPPSDMKPTLQAAAQAPSQSHEERVPIAEGPSLHHSRYDSQMPTLLSSRPMPGKKPPVANNPPQAAGLVIL
eukprot:TRINITY_DN4708_c0_g1_i1.p1 TRINITY_DN4708_c0_g1~~TRINITY_DN4708_c0_g1_i1.p1  ORF type:complete len:754 (-),score=125.87 TRINITY_DN4708_c0_g1_i1:212-2239(-)